MEETYPQLRQWAEQEGRSPEQLADRYLTQLVQRYARHPLLRWSGAWESHVTAAAERHDDYLGEALARSLQTNLAA